MTSITRHKQVDLTPNGSPTRRETLWGIVRSLKTFTAEEVFKALPIGSDIDLGNMRYYIEGWVNAGFLSQKKVPTLGRHGNSRINHYTLEKDVGVNPPIVKRNGKFCTKGQARKQMWNAMRINKSFSSETLAMLASTDSLQVTKKEAQNYIHVLNKAGYLKCLKSAGKERAGKYMLKPVFNTGPKPPITKQTLVVIDQNKREVVYPQGKDIQGDY